MKSRKWVLFGSVGAVAAALGATIAFATNDADSDQTVATFAAGLSDSSKAALDDGSVTHDELIAAFEAAVACMNGEGIAAELQGRDGQPSITVKGSLDQGQVAVGNACVDRHVKALSVAYALDNKPTGEDRRAAWEALQACFVANGGSPDTLPDNTFVPILDELLAGEQAELIGPCLNDNMVRFGFAY